MTTKFSLAEFAKESTRPVKAFVCTCKKCGTKMTDYVSIDTWLDIAYVLVQDDLLTQDEFKNLNHLAASQWETIKSTLAQGA